MRCGFCCLLAVAGDDVDALSSRHLIISSCGSVLRFLLACRLVLPSSRLISSPVVSPLFDTVGRGVSRGASASLLAWFCLAVCVDVDNRFVPFSSAMSPRAACFVGSAAGRWRSHLVVRGVLRCPLLARRLVSSRLVRRLVGRVGSCVSLAPSHRHGGRGVGR